MRELSEQIARILRSIPGAQDIRIERLSGQQSLTIDVDRNAIARNGINVADVHELIETAVGGREVSTLYEGERRFSIVARFPQHFRDSIESIRNLLLRAPDGVTVPLYTVANINIVDGPAQVSRENAKRRVVVGSNVEGRDLGGFVAEVQERIAKEVKLPDGYFFEWGAVREYGACYGYAFDHCPDNDFCDFLFTVHVVQFPQIGCFDHSGAAICIDRGVFGLFVTGEYLSVPASVGFIALWGIAVLNGVVLISYIRKLRDGGQREGCRH